LGLTNVRDVSSSEAVLVKQRVLRGLYTLLKVAWLMATIIGIHCYSLPRNANQRQPTPTNANQRQPTPTNAKPTPTTNQRQSTITRHMAITWHSFISNIGTLHLGTPHEKF
jgi:hypothetical protein